MKCFNKLMVFFLFLLFSYGADTFTYVYNVYNEVEGKVLKVQLYSALGTLGHPRSIKSGEKFRFNFRGSRRGVCLTAMRVWEKDSAGKWVKGKRLFKHSGLCENERFDLKLNSYGKLVAVRYHD